MKQVLAKRIDMSWRNQLDSRVKAEEWLVGDGDCMCSLASPKEWLVGVSGERSEGIVFVGIGDWVQPIFVFPIR